MFIVHALYHNELRLYLAMLWLDFTFFRVEYYKKRCAKFAIIKKQFKQRRSLAMKKVIVEVAVAAIALGQSAFQYKE